MRRREQEAAREEARNTAQYEADGAILECQCCYTDTPINRLVSCNTPDAHVFCYSCIKQVAKTQIGLMKYELKCMDGSGCDGGFIKADLREALDEATLAKLEDLQLHDEVAQASIEGLYECPFCDFKAICPPVEQDREFRCKNPSCKKVSCRLCKLESHIPKTCEEAKAKDKATPARIRVEEAMSEALIRVCPNPACKLPIIKEDGCNKMVCVKCRSIMCYVCKKNITRKCYNHFKRDKGGTCPLFDWGSVHDQHLAEVGQARERAVQEALLENPNIDKNDIYVNINQRDIGGRINNAVNEIILPADMPMLFGQDIINGQLMMMRNVPLPFNPALPMHPHFLPPQQPQHHFPQQNLQPFQNANIRPFPIIQNNNHNDRTRNHHQENDVPLLPAFLDPQGLQIIDVHRHDLDRHGRDRNRDRDRNQERDRDSDRSHRSHHSRERHGVGRYESIPEGDGFEYENEGDRQQPRARQEWREWHRSQVSRR